jgi:hypothetical protein
MTHRLRCDDRQAIVHQRLAPWPDHRQPSPHTRSTLPDAVCGAWGVFFPPSPSCLDDQRRLQPTQGHKNAQTLFGVAQLPWDQQIRTLRAPRAPNPLESVCIASGKGLEPHHMFEHLRVLGAPRWVSLEGPTSFSSQTLHGPHGLPRHLSTGQILSSPSARTPVLVCPGRPAVLACPPESLRPQDGAATQDGEPGAGTRWLSTQAQAVAPQQVPVRGEALSSPQPFCVGARQQGLHFSWTCKPDAQATLEERLAFWQATDGRATRAPHPWPGRCTDVRQYRDSHDVRRREGAEAFSGHGCDLTVVRAKTGEHLYHNRFLTDQRLSADNGADGAHAGRGRGQSEPDKNTVLKPKGDQLAHHFGPGQQYLAAFLRSLNLLAFLCHTVLEGSDAT